MRRLKIGVVGVGGQGKKHLLNCLRLKNVQLEAVADASRSVLSKVKPLGIRTYQDYTKMLCNENLDAVIIALPNFLHEECLIKSSENGYDIFVEKPLGRNLKEGDRIARCIRRTGVKLMVGMCHRFIPDCQKMKEEIEAEALGRIDFASALFFTGPFYSGKMVPGWMFDPVKIGGGALLDAGCHLIDLLIWFFGDVQSVTGHIESLFNLGYDDYAEVLLRFKRGVNTLTVVSWRCRIPSYRIEVVGEHGRRVALSKKFGIFDIGLWRGLSSFVRESISRRIRGQPFLPLGDDIYYKELDYFVKCILNDEQPKPNMEDWQKVAEIIDLVYQQNLCKDKEQTEGRRSAKIENTADYQTLSR